MNTNHRTSKKETPQKARYSLLNYLNSLTGTDSLWLLDKAFIATPNPEFVVYAQENPWFRHVLARADIAIPDGIGLVLAGKILGAKPLVRIAGVDLMEQLCQEAAERGLTVYFLGGREGVAQKALSVLQKKYPSLVGWADSGPKLDIRNWQLEIVEDCVERINRKHPGLLFVALGMGKQEKFIADNFDKLKVRLAMGVGGAFDYLSLRTPRPPAIMRKVGLEWLYRLAREPWRAKRQLALSKFVYAVLKEKLS